LEESRVVLHAIIQEERRLLQEEISRVHSLRDNYLPITPQLLSPHRERSVSVRSLFYLFWADANSLPTRSRRRADWIICKKPRQIFTREAQHYLQLRMNMHNKQNFVLLPFCLFEATVFGYLRL